MIILVKVCFIVIQIKRVQIRTFFIANGTTGDFNLKSKFDSNQNLKEAVFSCVQKKDRHNLKTF